MVVNPSIAVPVVEPAFANRLRACKRPISPPRRTCAIRGLAAGASSAALPGMSYRFVTCPETGHLEKIEFYDSPLGMLVTSCTRAPSGLECPRSCARNFDLRARLRGLRSGGVDCETEPDFG